MLVARCARNSLKAMRAALVDRRAIFAPLRLCGESCSFEAHAAAESARTTVQSSQFQRARSNEARSLRAQSAVVKEDVSATPGIARPDSANDRRRNRQRIRDMQKTGNGHVRARLRGPVSTRCRTRRLPATLHRDSAYFSLQWRCARRTAPSSKGKTRP